MTATTFDDKPYSRDYQPLKRRGRGDYRTYISPLKYALFAFAALLFVSTAFWSSWESDSWQSPPQDVVAPNGLNAGGLNAGDLNLAAKNARYAGLEAGKLPFTISADEVIQDKNRPNDLVMVTPQADILLDNGRWLHISADDAVIENNGSRLLLDNDVALHFSDGYELLTQEARLNMRLGILLGDKTVTAQGIDINFTGKGFRLHNSGRTLAFVGPAHLKKIQGLNTIDIQANENLQWHKQENKYIAEGGVKVTEQRFHLNTDKLEIFYDKNNDGGQELQWMRASGSVRLDSADGTITANKAVHHVKEQITKFSGDNITMDSGQVLLLANKFLEYRGLQEAAIAGGTAHVHSEGERLLRAETIHAKFSYIDGERQVSYVTAEGDVFINTGDSQISGNDGHYDFTTQKGRICGNTKIIRNGNELLGECASIDMAAGVSYIESPQGDNLSGSGRVHGTFQPQE